MEISIQKLPKSKIELKIEISAEEFEKFRKDTLFNLGKELKIEGFRSGHIPESIIEKEIGLEKILKEAAELAIKENYQKAISENNIEPLGQPEVEILKIASGNPLEFKVKVSVLPEIKLPDYKKIASEIQRKEIQVSEKEIEESLSWLQKSRAKFILKSEACQKGDFVELEYSSPQLETGKVFKDAFILGEGHFFKGFEENLENLNSNDEKEFSLKFPENHSQKNLAGQKVDFKVRIKSVQKTELPEINDQFAKSLGNFDNLVALKRNIKEEINLEKENAEKERICQEILNKTSQNIIFDIPEILIESERNRILEDLKKQVVQNFQISFEDYLLKISKTEKELLDSFSGQAEKRMKNSLILSEIGKKENIEVFDNEVKEGINKILKQYPDVKITDKGGVDLEKLKEYTKEVIRNEKTFQLLESFVE